MTHEWQIRPRWESVKRVWAVVWPFLLIIALVNAIYEWGYYRGHYAGQLHMKCAIFSVLDRMADAGKARDERYTFVNLGCRTDAHGKVQS